MYIVHVHVCLGKYINILTDFDPCSHRRVNANTPNSKTKDVFSLVIGWPSNCFTVHDALYCTCTCVCVYMYVHALCSVCVM